MNKLFRSLSIKSKLLFILLFSNSLSLILAMALLIFVILANMKGNARDDLTAMASLAADRSTAALSFDDTDVAKENLQALIDLPAVKIACLYDDQGQLFTSLYQSPQQNKFCPAISRGMTTHFNNLRLIVFEPVMLKKEKIGGIFIVADLGIRFWREVKFIGLILLVLFVTSVITFLLTMPLLNRVSMPIKKLADMAHKISNEKNYSHRALKHGDDEIGILVDAFNTMLGAVEHQNKALTAAKDNYRILYDNNPSMVFHLCLEGKIISVNRFGAEQLNVTLEQLQNCSIYDFIHPDDKSDCQALFKLCRMNPHKVYKQKVRKICRDGRVIWVRESARLLINEQDKQNILLVCEDITETKLLADKIEYQASHDNLTGLINRVEFDIHLQSVVVNAQKNHTEHALCYLDLDQFKVVNDTCGHLAGDELLRQLGTVLRHNIRQHDLLARLGGDEFSVLMFDCSLQQALNVSEKLRNVVRDFQFVWDDRCFSLGVSIGVSMISEISGNAVDILKEADAACYAAKEGGRNRVHVFSPDDEELTSRQGEMQWVAKIQRGLEENRFCLYGQLITPISANNEGLHFETLIRYLNEQGSIIPPGAFLPAAERYNVVSEMDRWVIKTLFSWLSAKPEFLAGLSLCSINLSGLSMSDQNMLVFIDQQFGHWQIPAEKICFEITETAAISNLNYARQFIAVLRNKGCSFSLDDFGSGLSSFAYLKNLPVDFLKIDGLFVKDILHDKVDKAMVESINAVGHVMGKKTIAEFVENQEILAQLDLLGVDYAQGYGIAKPVPLDEL